MIKIKFFNEKDTEKNINDFMKGKDIVDVKLSENDDYTTVMVIYKENENDKNN